MAEKFEVRLEKEKETKNTVRYAEVEGDGPKIIGTQYLQKWVSKKLGGGEFAAAILVTIQTA